LAPKSPSSILQLCAQASNGRSLRAARGRVVVALFGTDPDSRGALHAAIEELSARDRGSCQIVAAEREGWPADALLIATSALACARLFEGRPVVACRPLGIDETKVSYWRVRQGFDWFLDLGDRDPDFDAGNMAIFIRSPDGSWRLKTDRSTAIRRESAKAV
jgi:hypothetical protein